MKRLFLLMATVVAVPLLITAQITTQPSMVRGSVTVEGGGVRPRFPVQFTPVISAKAVFATVLPNGEFATRLTDGEYRLTLGTIPEGYRVKSITSGSMDLLANNIVVMNGAIANSISILLSASSPPPWVRWGGKVAGWPASMNPANYRLSLISGPADGLDAQLRQDGSFEFAQILPGNYVCTFTPPLPLTPFTISVPNKTVGGDFALTLPAMKEVRGKVTVEGLYQIIPQIRFSWGSPASTPFLLGIASAPAVRQPDGTFKVLMPEGQREVSINAPGFEITTARYGSTDLTRQDLNLSSTSSDEFQIVLKPSAPVVGGIIAPNEVPREIARIVDPCVGCVVGGGVSGSVAAPPPPPKSGEPVRIDGGVQAGNLIYHPNPPYPPLARTARIEGKVTLQATIAADGSIKNLTVITSSNPLLLTGVIDTVRTWKYKPTIINNQAVEVLTTITINFALGGPPPSPNTPNSGTTP
jgi:TonB family protein